MTVTKKEKFVKVLLLFVIVLLPWVIAILLVKANRENKEAISVKIYNYKNDSLPEPANHHKFKILQQEFNEPQEVTVACLSCHNKTGQEIMHTSHWNWSRTVINEKGDTVEFGKKNSINNFCIGIETNKPRCTSCHIGYGWDDKGFDFTAEKNIDCIVCHDQTGTYKKFPSTAGYPVGEDIVFEGEKFTVPNYNLIAQNVGMPKRENCGSCHYSGGGGNNVKHGDLEKVLTNTKREVDIHMGTDGQNMNCTACHLTKQHNIQGQMYSVSSDNKDRTTCQQCHSDSPHENQRINMHANKIACQTCHIPTYAKDAPTKMYWDWSTAGKLNADGSKITEKDSNGIVTYLSMKGNFIWEKNVTPEYVWFNGNAKQYLLGDIIDDTAQTVKLNELLGSYNDPNSKIIPVKVHRGKQIFDPINKIVIVPHLFGKDSAAYWKGFNWNEASKVGMASVGLPYSGEYTFIKTEMYWPINHMVSSRYEALKCADCHAHEGRLASLTGFYLVGRDNNNKVDKFGLLLILAAIGGVLVHSILRYIKVQH
jgi:octaheme c-type cytochrome (tetrathionate reductase family)